MKLIWVEPFHLFISGTEFLVGKRESDYMRLAFYKYQFINLRVFFSWDGWLGFGCFFYLKKWLSMHVFVFNASFILMFLAGGCRTVVMDKNFWTGYRRNIVQQDEILMSINIPYTNKVRLLYIFWIYKILIFPIQVSLFSRNLNLNGSTKRSSSFLLLIKHKQ